MTTDHNKDIATITYNHLNLPTQVTKTDGQYIQYIYDAAGIKLAQEVYNASAVFQKRTDYAGEFIYETTPSVPRALQFIQHEEGRIMPARSEYQYHLKDHLGNVRLTFTTKPETTSYLATMETENEQQETQAEGFQITASARCNGIEELNHTPADQIGTAGEVLRLNASREVAAGLSKSLQVQAGDNLSLKVYAKYADLRNNQSNVGTALLSLLASGAYTTQVLENGMVELFDGAGTSMGVMGSNSTPAGDVPAAYLNYTLFDEDMVPIPGAAGFQQISKAALIDPLTGLNQPHEELTLVVPEITQAGYINIWVSHDGTQNYDIYFDDLSIDHQHGPVVQADDYYPFGLTFNSWKRAGMLKNDFLYNGKEMQDELDLEWFAFGARYHDAALGRFFNIDPKAETYSFQSPFAYGANNPIKYIEVNGEGPGDVVVKRRTRFNKPDKNGNYNIKTIHDLGHTGVAGFKKNTETGKTEVVLDIAYNNRFVDGPFKTNNPNSRLNKDNPGLFDEVQAHEEGHADQYEDVLKNDDTFSYGDYKGSIVEVFDNALSDIQSNHQGMMDNAKSEGEANDIKKSFANSVSTLVGSLSNQTYNKVQGKYNGKTNTENDANRRATSKLRSNGKSINYINNNKKIMYDGKPLE